MLKPKVAFIGVKRLPATGGAARASDAIIKHLSSHFDITVYEIDTFKKGKINSSSYNSIIFKGNQNKRLNTFLYYFKSCFHALFKGNYDLIHTQHIYSGFIIPFLKIRYKVVNTVRGIIPEDDNKWNKIDKLFFRLFEKISISFSDVIVSVSKPQIDYLQSILKNKKQILFIPNGVEFDDSLLEKRNNSKKEYLVFSAARIIKLKGCHTFLRALKEIEYKNKVKLIGSLDHVKKYKNEIISLTKGLNVSLLGLLNNRDELFHELLTAKFFIFPSTSEGLSNMLLEVASLNIPIICSDIEQNRAVFNEDEVLFFRTEDYFDLSHKIQYAEKNIFDMEQRANKALSKLKQFYLWKDISKEYFKIYFELISKGNYN